MADEENQDQDFKAPSDATSSKNPLLTVVMLLNIIFMGGIAYLQFADHKKMQTNLLLKML